MEQERFIPNCYCNQPAVLKTAWTTKNPGRRFFGCHGYQSGDGCDYFDWLDQPLPHRTKSLLFGLLEKVDKQEIENKNKAWKWNSLKFFLVLVIGFYLGRMSCN
ncbi:uncharacterized protein LOC126680234 [Mercurialis annua]|uniref:uncharacterized protein LOC126680234 n=1 Tax=Mercurialis annua TaxID=3986 RepID=UPI002160A595|nr:uncharacterized protein LOC126680234 [Mercurialis annua]